MITAVNWGILTPALIGMGFISMATHRAYRYPLRPDSDTKTMWQVRGALRSGGGRMIYG